MKKLFVSVFALAAFAGPAMAADLYAPEPAVYDWSGAYVGGHIGYLWGDLNLNQTGIFGPIGRPGPIGEPGLLGENLIEVSAVPLMPLNGNGNDEIEGVIGGIVGGWNFQSGHWVYDIEGDFGWTGADASRIAGYALVGCGGGDGVEPICPEPEAIYESFQMNWNAHIRARVGATLGEEGRTLLFVAGGLAIADLDIKQTGGLGPLPGSQGGTYTGWSIGGGVNHAFSNNFIAGLEVLYDNYGSENYEPAQTGIIVCQIGQPCSPPENKVDLETLTVRATLTYHFN